MSADGRDVRSQIGDRTNVLFLTPPFTSGSGPMCAELLGGQRSSDAAVLFVVATRTPEDRLRSFRTHADGPVPEKVGFLSLGGGDRPSAADLGTRGAGSGERYWLQQASNPGNLTEIGVVLSNILSEWEGETDSIAVCFEPLTTLIQYAEFRKVFRFVHVFTRHVRVVGGTSHFHLNPLAHDETEVSRLLTLFDAVVELEDGGGVAVRTR